MAWAYKQLALHWANSAYKQNDCVHVAVITAISLLQHDVHNYSVAGPMKISQWWDRLVTVRC